MRKISAEWFCEHLRREVERCRRELDNQVYRDRHGNPNPLRSMVWDPYDALLFFGQLRQQIDVEYKRWEAVVGHAQSPAQPFEQSDQLKREEMKQDALREMIETFGGVLRDFATEIQGLKDVVGKKLDHADSRASKIRMIEGGG